MNGSKDDLEGVLYTMMSDLNMDKIFVETQGAGELIQKLAPQELDRLASVLYLGLRDGLARIVQNLNLNAGEQLKMLQSSIIKALQDASGDLEVKDLDKKFNVADFASRVYASLPRGQ